jgi:hypothetical protein
VLCPALYLYGNPFCPGCLGDPLLHLCKVFSPLFLFRSYECLDLVVHVPVEVLQRKIFQFRLNPSYPQPGGKRCVDIQAFLCNSFPFGFWKELESTHIMKFVGQLNKNYPDILYHGKKHLSDRLCLLNRLALCPESRYFGNPVYQLLHFFSKPFPQFLPTNLCILQYIMEECSYHRFRIHPKIHQDFRHLKGMDEKRLPAGSLLILVQFHGPVSRF